MFVASRKVVADQAFISRIRETLVPAREMIVERNMLHGAIHCRWLTWASAGGICRWGVYRVTVAANGTSSWILVKGCTVLGDGLEGCAHK